MLCATLGLWGGLGHWFLILAHRSAPAAVLAPYIYLGLIWMSVAGFLVFGDVPTWWTLTGAAVVILSGLYLLYRERKVVGPAPAPPPTSPLSDAPCKPKTSSWPGLSRPSTICLLPEDVDARHKAGHDEVIRLTGTTPRSP